MDAVKQCCQICSMNTHLADECPFLYTYCTMPNCTGIRLVKISGSIDNPKRKYIRCQFKECKGFQWLDDAVLQKRRIGSSSSIFQSCFSCEEVGHWMKDCPWKAKPCFNPECNVVRDFVKYKKERYLKCPNCGSFEWLEDAMAQENEKDNKRAGRMKLMMVAVNEDATVEQMCSNFKHMMSS